MTTVNFSPSQPTTVAQPHPPVNSLKSKVTCVALAVLAAAVVGAGAFLISSSLPISLAAGAIMLLLLCIWICYLNRNTTSWEETMAESLQQQSQPIQAITEERETHKEQITSDEPEENNKKQIIAPQTVQQPSEPKSEFLLREEAFDEQHRIKCYKLAENGGFLSTTKHLS